MSLDSPIDLGKGTKCINCNLQMCTCDQRQIDKTWSAPIPQTIKDLTAKESTLEAQVAALQANQPPPAK